MSQLTIWGMSLNHLGISGGLTVLSHFPAATIKIDGPRYVSGMLGPSDMSERVLCSFAYSIPSYPPHQCEGG